MTATRLSARPVRFPSQSPPVYSQSQPLVRKVDVGLDIAHGARIPVPVPRAAEIAAFFDQAQALHARLAQPGPGEQAAETTADHHRVDLVHERFAAEAGLDVRVVEVVPEPA